MDDVVAIELVVPDSGRLEVTDTLRPRARALNGRGDSVAATIVWASLDTILAVDSVTGVSVALVVGTARLQARAGSLRSNPANVFILPPLDTVFAPGATRDTVDLGVGDSLSDSLVVQVGAPNQGTSPLASRRVVFAVDTIYPAGAATLTLEPADTVRTNTSGRAAARLRFVSGVVDSVRVSATLRHANDSLVPGAPVTFVVEFRP